MTEFIDAPVVPLELTYAPQVGGTATTLYRPGWFSIDDEDSQAFLGVPGETIYGLSDLPTLAAYVRSAGSATADHAEPGQLSGLGGGPDIETLLTWTDQDFVDRYCAYDLVRIPELADGELAADEQVAVGSTLALALDALDFLEVEGEHADALREDEDVSKLAAGDELLAVFTAGRHRRHVVELFGEHWQWCVEAISRRITAPPLRPGA